MGGQPGRGLQLRLQGLAVFIWASPTKISFGQASLPRTGVTTAEALFIRTMWKALRQRREPRGAVLRCNSWVLCGEEGRWRLDRMDGSCSHTYSCCAIAHPHLNGGEWALLSNWTKWKCHWESRTEDGIRTHSAAWVIHIFIWLLRHIFPPNLGCEHKSQRILAKYKVALMLFWTTVGDWS